METIPNVYDGVQKYSAKEPHAYRSVNERPKCVSDKTGMRDFTERIPAEASS